MEVAARVNILGGRAVRLPRGDVSDALVLDPNPTARARTWQNLGADRIYVVDLDAAAFRKYDNRELIGELVRALECPVDVGGGIRSEEDAARILGAGASRIVIGTAAIEHQNMVWELCRTYPDRIVVALDVKEDEELLVHGWTEHSGRFLEEVILEMSSAGVAGFAVSEALHDALVDPPNFELLRRCIEYADEPVVAAGGVRNLDDLEQLRSLSANGRHLGGVIVGREVTEGRFSINQAKVVLSDDAGVSATRLLVRVADLAAMEGFYTDVLGCRLIERWSAPAPAGAIVRLAENSFVELIADDGGQGAAELILVVDDLDSWRTRIDQHGFPIARAVVENQWGTRSFGVDDPAGNRIWVSEVSG